MGKNITMWILGIFLFSISSKWSLRISSRSRSPQKNRIISISALVLPIDGSIAEERLNALALAGGWNVSAAIL